MTSDNNHRFVWHHKGLPVKSDVRHDQVQIHLDHILDEALYDKRLECFQTRSDFIKNLILSWSNIESDPKNQSNPDFTSNAEYYNVLHFLIDKDHKDHEELTSYSTRDLASDINDFLGSSTLQNELKRTDKLIKFARQSRQLFELNELNRDIPDIEKKIQLEYQKKIKKGVKPLEKTRELCKEWLVQTKKSDFIPETFESQDFRRPKKSTTIFDTLFDILRKNPNLTLQEKRTQVMNLITGISNHIRNIAIFKQLLADNANKLIETFDNSEKALSEFRSVIQKIKQGNSISKSEVDLVKEAIGGKLYFYESGDSYTVVAFEKQETHDFYSDYSKYSGDHLSKDEWNRYTQLVYQKELSMAPEDVLKKIDNENIFMYLWRRLSALFSPVSPEFIKTRLDCYEMILNHFQNGNLCNNTAAIPTAAHELAILPLENNEDREVKIKGILAKLETITPTKKN